MTTYAGIGSRKTPDNILTEMRSIAQTLALEGYTLRSGGAAGADTAFEEGCVAVHGEKEIFLPWQTFGHKWGRKPTTDDVWHIPDKAFKVLHGLAYDHNTNIKYVQEYVRKLFARNMMQILGKDLDDPVEFVVCWTPDGREVGGTRWAIWCAQQHDIPVYNLGTPGAAEDFWSMFT